MKTFQKLARAFKTLAEQGEQIDSTASAVLAIVKGAKAVSEKKFDELVEKAYEANGWNAQVGRPTRARLDRALDTAPNTVRTYVTIMRRAIRLGMHVGRYDTFNALRTALEKKAQPKLTRQGRKGRKGRKAAGAAASVARIPADLRQDFVGVDIETPREPNGSLIHDLSATFIGLNKESDRAEMGREMMALLHRWLPKAGVALIGHVRRANGSGDHRKAA